MIKCVFIGKGLDLGPDDFGRVAVSKEHVKVFNWCRKLGLTGNSYSVINVNTNLFFHAVHGSYLRIIAMGDEAEKEVQKYRQDYLKVECPKSYGNDFPLEAVKSWLNSFYVLDEKLMDIIQ